MAQPLVAAEVARAMQQLRHYTLQMHAAVAVLARGRVHDGDDHPDAPLRIARRAVVAPAVGERQQSQHRTPQLHAAVAVLARGGVQNGVARHDAWVRMGQRAVVAPAPAGQRQQSHHHHCVMQHMLLHLARLPRQYSQRLHTQLATRRWCCGCFRDVHVCLAWLI